MMNIVTTIDLRTHQDLTMKHRLRDNMNTHRATIMTMFHLNHLQLVVENLHMNAGTTTHHDSYKGNHKHSAVFQQCVNVKIVSLF